jgi:hypothetical protein
MTYKRYKLILLCFLIVFALLAGSRHLIKGSDLPTLIFVYSFGLLYWLALFFFLLHARKKGISENDKEIAPAKILPILVAWIVFISVLYPLAMAGIYKNINTMVYRSISEEDFLGRTKNAATNGSKTAEQRLKAAQVYYKYSGERIIYTDDHDRKNEYIPDASANQARLKYLETLKRGNNLYSFMVVSSALSLLSGGAVANIYLHTRKKYKHEKLT